MADADRASWGVGERTFMGQGFDNARAMLASSPRKVAKVVVLITDGKPSDNVQPTDLRTNTLQPSPAQVAANALKDNGYAVMALLIGDGVTKTDVGSFVTEAPIQIASFSALALAVTAVNTKLSATLCAEEKKVTLAPTKPVRPVAGWPSTCGKADVAFVVDASSSINTTSWNKQVKFLRSLMDSINIGTEAVQYGVTVFASSAKTLLPISADASKFDALAMADADRASWGVGERTFMGQGFDNARAMLASSPRKVAKVVVLVTDGKPSDNVQPTDLRTNTLQPSPHKSRRML